MPKSLARFASALVFTVFSATVAPAQQPDGGQTTTTGGTGIGGAGAASAAETVDPDVVFSDVERGQTVGATGATGQGFSELSASSGPAGGGGLGGFGGGLGGLGGFGGLGNLFGGGFNTGAVQTTKPAIRTRLRSAVAVNPRSPQRVQQTANQRFRSLSTPSPFRGVNVSMQGKTAILRGVVSSERDRRMSELLIRLEPGVRSVNNQVTVMSQ